MNAAKHAEHSGSKLTKGRESIGDSRGLRIKNGFAEPVVDHRAVTKHALEQRPQHLEIKQAFRDVKDQHTRRPIERLSPDQGGVETGGEWSDPDSCKDGTAADMIKITHKTAPFEDGVELRAGVRRCSSSRVSSWSAAPLVTGDKLIGNVVQIISDDLRLRADPQNIVANTLDQRGSPASRDGTKSVPCMAGDETELGGPNPKLFFDKGVSLARLLMVLHAVCAKSSFEEIDNAAMLKLTSLNPKQIIREGE
jgi:hypothetical protein